MRLPFTYTDCVYDYAPIIEFMGVLFTEDFGSFRKGFHYSKVNIDLEKNSLWVPDLGYYHEIEILIKVK